MKKLVSCLVFLFAISAVKAQGFEGTIIWSMKMEITDPAMKARMEEGMKKMSDPANQAKMKELAAKMNDPQMKAAMDANPQMKAQMENALKMMSGGDLTSMMPKGLTIEIKNENALTHMEGGPIAMDILYLKDKDKSYRLDRQNKTYSVMETTPASASKTTATPPKVTKTSETLKVLNYNCTKYLVEYGENSATIHQTIWTTTDIKDIDVKSLSRHKVGKGQSMYYEGMDGVPLRVEIATPQGKMSMEVTEIKRGGVNSDDFKIPADFKETEGGMFGKF